MTRQAIIAAAAAEFAVRGFEATTYSSIAAAMGKQKSAVGYHHFASKEEIALAVVAEQRQRWSAIVERVEAATEPGLVRLFVLLLDAVEDAREHALARATVRLLVEARAVGLVFPRSPFGWRATVQQQVQTAIDAGVIPAGASAETLTARLLNASFGVFEVENRGLQPADTVANLRALWADLLSAAGVADAESVIAEAGGLAITR